ncbi:flagellar hook-associated protein FlgK [Sphingomonas turrisvirgatae]|uniref:Flagellar hook-associated protein 1 n=1 Tax=Sphingomonas turrisvirgatae TaxID=1888892 RepID=A0A1E3M115_9SPHN|nr:flagellar hook-associated protein FlgK [Sphingomonas turrisvirgatae]ODP39055.1 flagellar hook-associated protein FlgK [Sphingomonas turrisvirgatae]
MSDMLSIGASGVRAYQTALTTTSENIANAGTAGYAKRVATTREVAVATSGMTTAANGMGVTVSGIARSGDAMRSADVRAAGADLARSEAGAVWLDRIEGALTGNKLDERLTAFFNAATTLSADPSASAPRATMLQAAASVANSFAATGAALDGAIADLDASADAGTGQLNTLSASLAKVNAGLGRVAAGTSGQAALLDERDRLLEAMSALTDVAVQFDSFGRVSVKGGAGGPLLVQGDRPAIATYARGSDGAVSFAVYGIDGSHILTPSGGALAGMAEGAARLADARRELDTIAAAFVEGVNAVQAGGADLDGNAGTDMFEGDSAASMKLVLSDPRGIAAAAAGAGPRDNGNLTALAALRKDGAFESDVTTLTTGNASALAGRRAIAEVQTTIRAHAIAARDTVSGVNIDEEAVDLIRFQQAYQASSRVIQVARETLDTLFNIR